MAIRPINLDQNLPDGSEWVFNQNGYPGTDFRVEGDTETHLLFVDAGNDRVGIGTSSPSVALDVDGAVKAASGVTITAGGLLVTAGRIREVMTPADLDAQSGTLTAAHILGGILVHTTATGGGTVTTDTAANIIAGVPLSADGQCVKCYYINDGDQTATFAGGTGVTVADTGNTVATNEAATLLFRRTGAAAVTLYIL